MKTIKPEQDKYIREEALRLYRQYVNQDLAHDARSVFRLAGECLRRLILRYDSHPLAVKYAARLVDHFSGIWYAANQAA